MKKPYEINRFTHSYAILAGVFLAPVFAVSLWCSEFNIGKAAVISLLYLLFAICACLLFRRVLSAVLSDMEDLSRAMVDAVEGREDYTAEVYKEGTMGVLYTNFYKMVSALRESQLKTGEEKKFLQETISDISHQLKTPLASLHVFWELLYENKVTEPDKQKQILAEAQNQLDRMEWLVLSMLKLARIDAGVVLFEKKMHSGTAIAEQAAESVRYLTDARKQTVRIVHVQNRQMSMAETGTSKPHATEAPGITDITLCCDREWLTEALINLLKNASDYSGENTEITIELEDNRLYTRISVRDQGIGIPEEALPHIFERFYRVNNEVNPNSIGIGLALTKSIAEGMGGRITVRSETGKYSCFMLTFMKLQTDAPRERQV